MHERFEKRIEDALTRIAKNASKRRYRAGLLERRIGRILERNSRAAGLFDIQVTQQAEGYAKVSWSKKERFRM